MITSSKCRPRNNAGRFRSRHTVPDPVSSFATEPRWRNTSSGSNKYFLRVWRIGAVAGIWGVNLSRASGDRLGASNPFLVARMQYGFKKDAIGFHQLLEVISVA